VDARQSAYRRSAKAPLPKIAAQTPSRHEAAALARKWQLAQLAGRLERWRGYPANVGSHQFIMCCAQFGRDALF
jgi:hypothetical protein